MPTTNKPTTILGEDTITCPKCGRCQHRWEWHPLDRPQEYREQLVAIYRCTVCRHVFAPLPLGMTYTPPFGT